MRLSFFRQCKKTPTSTHVLEAVRSVFSKFRRIQKLNTRALELMAEMEQVLGGGYIFDRAFLESAVRELTTLAYQVVYSLNAMSRNRYVGLFDRFQGLKDILDEVLAGGVGPFQARLTLPYPVIGWEMAPLVGTLNACLAEARNHLELTAPDGFAVTATGCRLLLKHDGGYEPSLASGLVGLAEARFPLLLEEAIGDELESLFARRGGPSRLTVRVSVIDGCGGPQPVLNGKEEVLPGNIFAVCGEVLAAYRAHTADREPFENPVIALAVHEAVPAAVSGLIRAEASSLFAGGVYRVAATCADHPEETERFLVRKVSPFELVQSEILPGPFDRLLPDGMKPLSGTSGRVRRGSGMLETSFLKAIAHAALAFERLLGCGQEVRWVRGEAGKPVIVEVHPTTASISKGAHECDLTAVLNRAEVLVTGGETAQAGVAAGVAVHVTENDDPESFPLGAVAVTRAASPRLSPFLTRASAVLSELGSSVGHLATIARELRVPAIFGVPQARECIPDGSEVTVDAGERTVYRGIVAPLLACGEGAAELNLNDPEYVSLRSLLRWITPLQLIDPESPYFAPESCKTYHDLIHFAHERSVEELLHLQEHAGGLSGFKPRKIALAVPVDLFVTDIGGGLAEKAGDPVAVEDVLSEPCRPFLNGLTAKEMWSSSPAGLRLRDILSGLDRTASAMTPQAEYSGRSHVIVASHYMNLGLRLGYHFSVVDSYIGKSVNQNYIYFRFVGGFADERRRRLRADLIRSVLEEMHFKVAVKGDLVVGKLKVAAKEELTRALFILGALTGFTRQLDISLASEEAVEQFAGLFRERSSRVGLGTVREGAPDD